MNSRDASPIILIGPARKHCVPVWHEFVIPRDRWK
jgi:hypothetical protein